MEEHECLQSDVGTDVRVLVKDGIPWIFHAVQVDDEDVLLAIMQSEAADQSDEFRNRFSKEFFRSLGEAASEAPDAASCALCRDDGWLDSFRELLSQSYAGMRDPEVRLVRPEDVPVELVMEFELEMFGTDTAPEDMN